MKKYIVIKDIEMFSLRQGDVLAALGDDNSYSVYGWVKYFLPGSILKRNPEYFEEVKETICKECGRLLTDISDSVK